MDLKVTIAESGGVTTLQIESPSRKTDPLTIQPLATLRTINGAARASLERKLLKGRLDLNQSPARCGEFLQQIQGVGASALRSIFGEDHWRASTQAVQGFLARELEQPTATPPVLWLSSPVDLPVEILPLLPGPEEFSFQDGRGGRSPAAERQVLAQEAEQTFLGMRFAIRRVSPQAKPFPVLQLRPEPDSEEPRVPFTPYCHMDFARFAQDMDELTHLECYAIRPPLPDAGLLNLHDRERRLARRLLQGDDEREEIVHITAHCRTPADSTFEHALVFGGRGFLRRSELPLTMEILDGVSLHLPAGDVPDGPLAVLSACGANDVTSDAPTTIPAALLGAGYRAVVAPLVSLHVESARQVAWSLFEAIAHGGSVGEALVSVRRGLIAHHGNPLALVYACYGESRLRMHPDCVRAAA